MLGQLQTQPGQLLIPEGQGGITFALPQKRVALLQQPPDASPEREKALLHMEHAPIDEGASLLRTAGQQREAFGMNQLQR